MLYSASLREMMQNAVNESFWDAHGVEIGACAIFDHFDGSGKIDGTGKQMTDSMLGDTLLFLSSTQSIQPEKFSRSRDFFPEPGKYLGFRVFS